MNKKFDLLLKVTALTALLALLGCAEPGIVIKNGPAGPNTGDMLGQLPEGLVADKDNARHGTADLKPEIN
ncbi:MAG: hypothetical protein HOH19_02285 [Kordiimonadaceae bacterium]|nr:hypothetical protein [Kordiimonadaceae bacterium]MBT6031376.1 hypothetical protein [Kordiimonadaceae bacterium]